MWIQNGAPTIVLAQAGKEFLGSDNASLLLVAGNGVKEIGQTGEEVLVLAFGLSVQQDVIAEAGAKVERLDDRVEVARVAKLHVQKEERCQKTNSGYFVQQGATIAGEI